MNVSKIPARLFIGISITIFFGIALFIRVYFPYDQVFSGDWIKFTGVDAYYYIRIVDNLVHNFPQLISFDPYSLYPGGAGVSGIHFLDWLLAGIIWVIGLGSPTEHTVDAVAVYFPAVLGALTVIPVYFIGKELFGHWAGVVSAGLLAVLPGEFLGRSILGFNDTHAGETLFTATAMLFLVLAIKVSRERQLTINHLRQRDWATSSRPVIYSLLAGIFLGIYLISWFGALLFVFIISVYFFIQFSIDHLRRQSTDYLCLVGVILFLVALIIYAPSSRVMRYLAPLGIALLVPVFLWWLSRWMGTREIRPVYYPLALAGLGVVGLIILYVVAPSLFETMSGMFIWRKVATTMEMQPLLLPGGKFTLLLAWGNFHTGFFISLVSLGILACLAIKHGSAERSLLVVWSLIILFAMLGQRRFAYYFAVNVALLTGYASWQLLQHAGFKVFRPTIRYINMALAVCVISFLLSYPGVKPVVATAGQAQFAPSDAWCSSLTWLRENTPEPFGNSNFYYQFYEPPAPEEDYQYPESAYGVMAWWDYGYWITRIGRRLPTTNPTKPSVQTIDVARCFLSQNEASAREIIEELHARYIVIDYTITTNKLWAIAEWAGMSRAQFFDVYFVPQEDKLIVLFHPEYYRLLSVRLYNFDGQAVAPEVSKVISYEEKVTREGKPYKEVTSIETFSSYEEAAAFISSQESGNYRIVSDNPFISPVPLETLQGYRLVHSSAGKIVLSGVGVAIPEVKIFEYIGDR